MSPQAIDLVLLSPTGSPVGVHYSKSLILLAYGRSVHLTIALLYQSLVVFLYNVFRPIEG
jgi:hypothetical protein